MSIQMKKISDNNSETYGYSLHTLMRTLIHTLMCPAVGSSAPSKYIGAAERLQEGFCGGRVRSCSFRLCNPVETSPRFCIDRGCCIVRSRLGAMRAGAAGNTLTSVT